MRVVKPKAVNRQGVCLSVRSCLVFVVNLSCRASSYARHCHPANALNLGRCRRSQVMQCIFNDVECASGDLRGKITLACRLLPWRNPSTAVSQPTLEQTQLLFRCLVMLSGPRVCDAWRRVAKSC